MTLPKADLIDSIYNRFDFSKAKSIEVVDFFSEIRNVPIGEMRFIRLGVNTSASLQAFCFC